MKTVVEEVEGRKMSSKVWVSHPAAMSETGMWVVWVKKARTIVVDWVVPQSLASEP